MELLEEVAALTAPAQGSTDEVLEAFHGARDNHIFRILATITDPLQKPKSRARALEELPKRIKHLGDQVSTWVKSLARRCNMGDFVNADVIGHCVLLAQECFFEKDIAACSALLSSVKVATAVFPSLCAPTKTYTTLSELLSDVRSSHGTLREEADEVGLVTTLSSILSAAAQGPAFVDKVRNLFCSLSKFISFIAPHTRIIRSTVFKHKCRQPPIRACKALYSRRHTRAG